MDESFFDSDTDDDEEDKDPAHQANDFFQSLKPSSLSQPQPWDPSNNSPQLLEAQPSDRTQPLNQADAFFQSLKPPASSQTQLGSPSNNSLQLLEAQPSDQTQPVNRTSDLFRSLKGSPTGQDDSTNAEATPEIIPGLRSGLSRGQPAPTRQVSAGAPAATGVPQAAAPTVEIIPGLRAADSPVQPGANTQADSPTAPDPQKSLSGIVSGSEDVEVPPAKAPQSSPKTVTIGDDDIDRALDKAYSIIAHNQLDKGFRGIETGTFFPSPSQFKQAVITSLRDYGDYYGHMQDLDTDVAFNRDTFYKYEGNKYPLLTGKTFSGPDLNYLGVGAGFAAGGFPRFVAKLGAYWWKNHQYGEKPSAEALAAEEAGWQAYWKSRAYQESPFWRQTRVRHDPSTHPVDQSDEP